MVTALFCGEGALLIQCAEHFAQAGGEVAGVISANPMIAEWAAKNDVSHLGSLDGLSGALPSVDYFFSIANLRVLPNDVFGAATKAALNFHDGPLPALSGLNVTSWAILGGRDTHATTWHEITEGVDEGRVFAVNDVEIGDADTAFNLNSKCYEAGFAGFQELVQAIFGAGLNGTAQTGERGWYPGSKRPAGLGVIDPTQSTRDSLRLIHALDFGPGVNTLGYAKLWSGTQLLRIAGASEIDGSGTPGQVLSADGKTLEIATGDGAIALELAEALTGDAEAVMPAVGATLPSLPALTDDTLSKTGKAELYWAKRAATLNAALPAHVGSNAHDANTSAHPLPLPTASTAQIAAAWLAWCAGQNGASAGALSLTCASEHPAISDRIFLSCDIGKDTDALNQAVAEALEAAQTKGPVSTDFAARLDADNKTRVDQLARIVLSDTDATPSGTFDLALVPAAQKLISRNGAYDSQTGAMIAAQFAGFAAAYIGANAPLDDLPLAQAAATTLASRDDPFDAALTIQAAFAAQVAATPDKTALEAGETTYTFAELDARTDELARALAERGAASGATIGVCHRRNADLVISLLAVLKTGAAYLPLDPTYPADRIKYMIEDSGARLIVCDTASASALSIDRDKQVLSSAASETAFSAKTTSADLAYQIYTSGSTGNPKGVMVTHRNAINFFAGMDGKIPLKDGARLLAVTSMSFDISVLEIFWTLTRGATLVLQTDGGEAEVPAFSLFYFASESAGSGHHAYRLLIEGAKFADENGFEAIWNPERHFHAFGGLYPNPAVSLAAVAGMTKNVKLRGGSCVLPLHHPVRAAEDWALLDNLSNGRAGMAVASGWQPDDFIIQPQNFANRKDVMVKNIETVRALWRGEKRVFPGHDGKDVEVEIFPRPVQDEIPMWVTAAGNPETFAIAARNGFGVLTHLLGQTFDEVSEKVAAYRAAWKEAGHEGNGTVTLMLHTFVGESDEVVLETVRAPMKRYLKSATDLIKRASWSFPTFKTKADATGKSPQEVFEEQDLSAEEMDALLDHAFERYYQTSGLFGTVESAKAIVRKVSEIGVDEIACQLDFGVDTDFVLENLPNLKLLKDELGAEGGLGKAASVPDNIRERNITHLQCTPSMAAFIAADEAGRDALGQLDVMMVGGEALPRELARDLNGALKGTLYNMYGPTETTIWSSVAKVDGDAVTLGQPIANTTLSIRSETGKEMPPLVPGELWIGGEGVTNGYWQRPDLTADRFVDTKDGKFYRTGDLVRIGPNGDLEFLGRIDNQVKVSGYRIELGEIESALRDDPQVTGAVVSALDMGAGDKRLVGYVTMAAGATLDEAQAKSALATRLPTFMVPARIMTLASFPQTPNGKIDRKALPSPYDQTETQADLGSQSDTEKLVSDVWKAALGLPSVSTTANFFDLGGHSLLVVQVQRELQEKLGRNIAVTDVFRFTTIKSFSEHIDGGSTAKPSAKRRGADRAKARLARMGKR